MSQVSAQQKWLQAETIQIPLPVKLYIERKKDTGTLDSSNVPIKAWTQIGTQSGAVEGLRGGERWYAQQVRSTTNVKVTMRFFRGLLETDRLRYVNKAGVVRYINISYIDDVHRAGKVHLLEGTEIGPEEAANE